VWLGLKRFFDIVCSVIALIVLSPLLFFLVALVYLVMGRPALFRSERSGLKGRSFVILKFRTMTDERDEEGNLLPDNERLTELGKFLRSTSLDELPQMFNVVRGEMSLIGPRPLPAKYLPFYNERQARRHEVKPGITGWMQATYRGQLRSWEERLEQDVWYVENWSLWLDVKIIFMTFWTLILRMFSRKKREEHSQIEFNN